MSSDELNEPQRESTPRFRRYKDPADLEPHRGVLVLTLGIMGLFSCALCGVPAFIMGRSDLREIDEGRMNPEGRTQTKAGMILGLISVVYVLLAAIYIVVRIMGAGVE